MAQQEEIRDAYFSYYKNNIDTLNKKVDYKNVRVDFRFASQIIDNNDGTKMILYPFVAYNKVEDVVVAKISENEETVEYYFAVHDELINNAITEFNQSLSSRAGDPTYGTFDIEPVVIDPPKPKPSPPKHKTLHIDAFDFHLPPIDLPTGGGGSGTQPAISTLTPPQIPIENIADFLSCLNPNQAATLTIFAEKTNLPNVGHAFISVAQGNNVMTYGFYPQTTVGSAWGTGTFGNNGYATYNAGWSTAISSSQLQQLIQVSISYDTKNYDLLVQNCADFAIEALIIAGLNTSTFGVDTPTTVFNMISTAAQLTNGNAPPTNRTCP